MTPREKAAARIRALKAVTVENGYSETEALFAAERLGEALREFNMTLDEADLRASPFDQAEVRDRGIVGTKLWKPASAIAKLTNTKTWTGGSNNVGAVVFLGLKHEVEIATYLTEICRSAMQREVDKAMQGLRLLAWGKAAAKLLPFVDGMADRLYTRIMAMVPVAPPGKGLIVLRGALITEEMARRGINLEPGGPRRSHTHGAYKDGLAAGDKVALNPGLAPTGGGLRISGR